MARSPRSEQFDPMEVSVFHCINRCVRRCFLCGIDPLTGDNYEHRKAWIEKRLQFLAAHFGIDLLGFAILANHFHLILCNRPDIVGLWSDQDVAYRWLMLCPIRKQADGSPETPLESEIRSLANDGERLAEIRRRLSDISWFMRMVAENVARRANDEDGVTGRFWQGRFRGVKLCDGAAILACLMYVDLNPIRAGVTTKPEESEYTSARRRIDQHRGVDAHAADWLAPLTINETAAPGPMPARGSSRCSDKGFLLMSLAEYLTLLDWTGRQVADGKSGSIPEDLSPILIRLGIDTEQWLSLCTRFGQLFYRVAGGREAIAREAGQKGRRWYQAPGSGLLSAVAA